MHRRAATALIISGLTALGVYRYRRRLISRPLRLPPVLHDVAVERGLRIPMPDGVELVADRYLPREPGHFPTILVRTPYGRRACGFFVSQRMAERGYNVLVQDVRGRFESGGDSTSSRVRMPTGRRRLSGSPTNPGSMDRWGCGG
jgi:uncharacterized protein